MLEKLDGLLELIPEGARETVSTLVGMARAALGSGPGRRWLEAAAGALPRLVELGQAAFFAVLSDPTRIKALVERLTPGLEVLLDALRTWSPSEEELAGWLQTASEAVVDALDPTRPGSFPGFEEVLQQIERASVVLVELATQRQVQTARGVGKQPREGRPDVPETDT